MAGRVLGDDGVGRDRLSCRSQSPRSVENRVSRSVVGFGLVVGRFARVQHLPQYCFFGSECCVRVSWRCLEFAVLVVSDGHGALGGSRGQFVVRDSAWDSS